MVVLPFVATKNNSPNNWVIETIVDSPVGSKAIHLQQWYSSPLHIVYWDRLPLKLVDTLQLSTVQIPINPAIAMYSIPQWICICLVSPSDAGLPRMTSEASKASNTAVAHLVAAHSCQAHDIGQIPTPGSWMVHKMVIVFLTRDVLLHTAHS